MPISVYKLLKEKYLAMDKRLKVVIFAALLTGLMIVSPVTGEEYRIGPDDVLEIKFWQDPALNTQTRVGQDGGITIDIIGRIQAAGKTTEQLQNDIVRQIARLNKKISQAVVVVVEFNYNHVFLTGQVKIPGKLAFEKIPDLWTIINEAGGINEFGDLGRVTIIRGGDRAGEVEIVDVREAISRGQLDRLPKIYRQDTIEIPRSPAGLPTSGLAQATQRRDIVYIIGAVKAPGAIKFEENLDILEALALAGGPSPDADLKKVKVITKDGFYAQSLQMNLEKYSETGAMPRYVMRREDSFIVPQRKAGFLGIGLGNAAAVVGVISSAVLIYTQLSDDSRR